MAEVLKELNYDSKKVLVECARRDGSGNTITSTYATISTVNTKLSTATFNTYIGTTAPNTYVKQENFKTNYLDTNNVAYTDAENTFTAKQVFNDGGISVKTDSGYAITMIDSQGKIKATITYNGIQLFDNQGSLYSMLNFPTGQVEDTFAFKKELPDMSLYYTKTETYSQSEVNNLISNIKTGAYQVVAKLPATGEEGVVYLVGSEAPYTMYVWEDGAYISIGTTEIDLTGYMKTLSSSGSGVLTSLTHDDSTNVLKATFTDLTVSDSVSTGQYVSAVSQASNGKITVSRASLPASTNQTVGVGTTTFGASSVVKFAASQSDSSLATLSVSGNATANTITYALNTSGITTALAGKQATLTAGNGITITNNTVASLLTATDISITLS